MNNHTGSDWVELGELVEYRLGQISWTVYSGIQQFLMPPLAMILEFTQLQDKKVTGMADTVADAVHQHNVGIKELQILVAQLQDEKKALMRQVGEVGEHNAQLVEERAKVSRLQVKLKIAQNLLTSLKLENIELTGRNRH